MTKRKKTPAEILDDNERTNSQGLFLTAHAYWEAAQVLAPRKGGHRNRPAEHLFVHAIELYLKSLLGRLYGVEELRTQFSHNIPKLQAEAKKHRLAVSRADRKVLAMLTVKYVLHRRYLYTGSVGRQPTIGELDRACKNLHRNVFALLGKAGVFEGKRA